MAKYSFDAIAEDNVTAMETLKQAGVQFNMNPDIQSFKNKLGGAEYYKRYEKESWYNQAILDRILSGNK
jgi:TRAP-type C4-dicarboxylate transport system substrate-binding protein